MVLNDSQIQQLLKIPKKVLNPKARKTEQKGSEQINYELESEDGKKFKLYWRQNLKIAEGFSCGLSLLLESGATLTLTRYNGSDHIHANPLEGEKPFPPTCHIHVATERYMLAGKKPEHYAQPTDRYHDLKGALNALLSDCNISGLEENYNENQLTLI